MSRILVVAGGGGFRGAVEVPILRSLVDTGNVAKIMGTSVGALNGAMVASEQIDRLEDIWEGIDGISDFMSTELDAWNGLHSLRPTRKMLRDVGALHPKMPLSVGIYDYGDGKHVEVGINDLVVDEREDAIIASSSIPGIHERARFRGRESGDGGIAAPVGPVSDWESYDEIHAIFCQPPPRVSLPKLAQRQVNGLLERLVRAVDENTRNTSRACWRRLRRWAGTVPTYVYFPTSWAEIGPTFEADRKLNQHRLKVIGPQMLKNRMKL